MKKQIRYTALCCFLSACLVLLYSYQVNAFSNKEEKTTDEGSEKEGLYSVPEVQAGMQFYLDQLTESENEKIFREILSKENGKKTENSQIQQENIQNAFCSQAQVMAAEPAMAADSVSTSSVVQLNASDYECLLRIVESEAGICDKKGKVLIANVILNRMESSYFPDTVEEVVYQKKQFSPVENGSIDRVTVTEETKEAVSMALSGTDYSEGALFFAARDLADQKNMDWFDDTLDFLFEHDGHEFFTIR